METGLSLTLSETPKTVFLATKAHFMLDTSSVISCFPEQLFGERLEAGNILLIVIIKHIKAFIYRETNNN